MIRRTMLMGMACLMAVSSGYVLAADEQALQTALQKQMYRTKITLQQGMTAAEEQGQVISAKFELEDDKLDGKFQVSIFVTKGGKFNEVIVSFLNGKPGKPEALAGEELAEGKAQAAAMAKAKITLKAAVDKALTQAEGYRAIGITPSLKDGHAVASVVLLKDTEFKTVELSLE
ncbi:MAG TPA: hypothetical protein VGN55_19280 [Xanthobacteraceae bacterium]